VPPEDHPILYVSNWLCSVVVLADCRGPFLRVATARVPTDFQERPSRSHLSRRSSSSSPRLDWGFVPLALVHILGARRMRTLHFLRRRSLCSTINRMENAFGAALPHLARTGRANLYPGPFARLFYRLGALEPGISRLLPWLYRHSSVRFISDCSARGRERELALVAWLSGTRAGLSRMPALHSGRPDMSEFNFPWLVLVS